MKGSPCKLRKSFRSVCRPAFCLFFCVCSLQAAASGKATSYPEKGKVVAVRLDEKTDYVPITPPDSKGRTSGGEAFVHRRQIYRVETDSEVYEFEGGKKPTLAVGDAVEFRIDKSSARVRTDGPAKKYRVLSATARSAEK
jgi:hypothetical protein